MVTTAEDQGIDPGLSLSDQAEVFAREVIAGHPQGAVRRIVLYVAAFAAVVSPLPMLAVIPLALLVATDVLA